MPLPCGVPIVEPSPSDNGWRQRLRIDRRQPSRDQIGRMLSGWLLAALQVQTNQKTIILQIPLVFIFSFLPLMGVLMLIRIVHVIYQDIQELKATQ